MALEQELKTYEEHLEALLADRGKFVVIHKDQILGTYLEYEDALKVGYDKCGTEPFLVKRIAERESLHHFSRDQSFDAASQIDDH